MRPALTISLCLLAAGCMSAKVQLLDEVVRPAQVPDSVAVLSDAPNQPYTVIAVVKVSSPSITDSFADLRQRLTTEAATIGADAVILGHESKKWIPIFNTVGFVMSERKNLEGKAIVFDRSAG